MHPIASPDSILALAEALGLTLHGTGDKRSLRCPLPGHDDRSPSAVIFLRTQRFHCAVCTPGRSLSTRELAAALGTASLNAFSPTPLSSRRDASADTRPTLTPAEAQQVWRASLAAVRSPAARDALAYLARRNLDAAARRGLCGILTRSQSLPATIRSWPARGYAIVVPLYDVSTGEIVSLQARSIERDASPKTLLPAGTRARGAVFASPPGLEVLRGERPGTPVILAEGLTDSLALGLTAAPVLSAPGTNAAVHAVGPWVRGRRLIIALDDDPAGDAAAAVAARLAHLGGAGSVERVRWPLGAKDACEALEMLGTDGFTRLVWIWMPREVRRTTHVREIDRYP